MKQIKLEINIEACHYDELTEKDRKLIDAACEATKRSYAPYSHFAVGAAALLENDIVITFTNKGHQIPEQKLKAIFEKFYRVDNARSSQTGGSGLGLSIAKQIVELHGGKIEAASDRYYTTFTVSLPAYVPESQLKRGRAARHRDAVVVQTERQV